MVLEVKVQLRQGGSVVALPVEELVKRFLKYKEARIRGEWDSKQDAGLRSITQERYGLIAGKLRNYLVPCPGRHLRPSDRAARGEAERGATACTASSRLIGVGRVQRP